MCTLRQENTLTFNLCLLLHLNNFSVRSYSYTVAHIFFFGLIYVILKLNYFDQIFSKFEHTFQYLTPNLKFWTAIDKEALNRKISLLTSKLNIELRKKLVCYVWRIALYGSETWTIRKFEWNYLEGFEIWCGRRMEMIKWSEKITNG